MKEQMNTNEKLEIFRKTYCLGLSDITKVFKGNVDDHLLKHLENKYMASRDQHGFYGNFHFLMHLDLDLARMLLERVGL